ncbi:protein transport protein sec24-like, putative [Theileria annulata]|uniref:Protein transport protein sec24-like, putative n=1 Tax=Theileria annulata TaxID=5874 RepID=Q4UG55_THEAN|nr:protein transport protein sec24-like, putative [Theileria annulata]CAI73934.1 protein transport protein sec24-like, putative [Theileria annulata]|eukprot:XP_954611.1 protein transport protein sec24-like, putative [Theileria annulata]
MASNWPNPKQGLTSRASNPFPNVQNSVHQTPFANTTHPPTHPPVNPPPTAGGYGYNQPQTFPGQQFQPASAVPPPYNPNQSGLVNRSGLGNATYSNPPSVHFSSSLDYTSHVPPAFSEPAPAPVPPPKLEEINQSQTPQGVTPPKSTSKTLTGQVFHDNFSSTSTLGYKTDEDVLDSVVLANTTKNFVSLSVGTLPATDQLHQKSGFTLSYTISPLNPDLIARLVETVPLVNHGNESITRCKQCRAYINPFVRTDASKRFWICNLCETSNELQTRYLSSFNQYPGSNQANELELNCGVIEFMASADYTVRPPQPPSYLFLIDVSSNAVNSRMLEVVCKTIKELILDNEFASDNRTLVGLMTFDSSVHFYQISRGSENYQLLVVADLEDLFLPLPGEVLLNLQESSEDFLKLLDTLPSLWKNTTTTGSALGSAIRSAHYSMKHVGGKLIVFAASPCTFGDFSITSAQKSESGTQSSNVLNMNKKPTTKIHPLEKCKDFSCMMCQTQTTLDLFVCTPQSLNLDKLQYMSTMTSGNIYYHPFKNHAENFKLVNELKHLVRRTTVWESVMRIRLSKGWKVTNWHGNCFVRGSDLMVLPTTSEDHSYTITFVPDTANSNNTSSAGKKVMYIQTALLHTNSSGERRIRVFNTAVGVSNDLGTVLNSVNVETLVFNMLLGAVKVYQTSGKMADARNHLTTHCSRVMNSMSILGSTADSARVLSLYVLGLLKSTIFTDEHNQDYRVYLSTKFRSCKIDQVILYAYPQLYNLSNELNSQELLLQGLPLSIESVLQECFYLLFNGEYLLLWVGKNVPNNLLQTTFDAPSFEHLNVALVPHALEQSTSNNAHKVKVCLETLRARVPPYVPLMVLKQGESDSLFYSSLVQDKTHGMMVTFQEFYNSMQPTSALGIKR